MKRDYEFLSDSVAAHEQAEEMMKKVESGEAKNYPTAEAIVQAEELAKLSERATQLSNQYYQLKNRIATEVDRDFGILREEYSADGINLEGNIDSQAQYLEDEIKQIVYNDFPYLDKENGAKGAADKIKDIFRNITAGKFVPEVRVILRKYNSKEGQAEIAIDDLELGKFYWDLGVSTLDLGVIHFSSDISFEALILKIAQKLGVKKTKKEE